MKRHKPITALNPHAEESECPKCGSQNLEYMDCDFSGDHDYEYYGCQNCGFCGGKLFERVFVGHLDESGARIE